MVHLWGIGASEGAVIGRIKRICEKNTQVEKYSVDNVAKEIQRFNCAVEKTKERLGILYEKTCIEVSEEEAEIFSVHIMMLEDGSLTDCCESIIYEQSVNAEFAIEEASKVVSAMLLDTNDEYMMARTADVEGIKDEILSSLSGEAEEIELNEGTIIFADDLTPAKTVNLDKSKIAGFVTQRGSKYSHTAILARSMGIAAVIGVSDCMKEAQDGEECAIDAEDGSVYICPDEETKEKILAKSKEHSEKQKRRKELIGKKSVTKSGKTIRLYANIGGVDELDAVKSNDAEGVGLFRSEFLYIGKDSLPDEEMQYEAYKSVLSQMGEKETIIRTLDIGADKQANCLELEREENPALGFRAIRICLDKEEIFRTQLRALLRASAFGNLSVMLPMISSCGEVERAKEIIARVKEELQSEGKSFSENVKLGIMIETPGAALISDRLARMVDFFSIGTNDLIQYTLAADRQNEKIAHIYNPMHPAVLKLIKLTCDNAHRAGIWAGVCGELAANPDAVPTLIALGADELSVSPGYVLSVREKIINCEEEKICLNL